MWTRVTCHAEERGLSQHAAHSVEGDTGLFILSFIFITQLQTQRAGDTRGWVSCWSLCQCLVSSSVDIRGKAVMISTLTVCTVLYCTVLYCTPHCLYTLLMVLTICSTAVARPMKAALQVGQVVTSGRAWQLSHRRWPGRRHVTRGMETRGGGHLTDTARSSPPSPADTRGTLPPSAEST